MDLLDKRQVFLVYTVIAKHSAIKTDKINIYVLSEGAANMVDKIGGPQRHLFHSVTLQHEKTTEIKINEKEKVDEDKGQSVSHPNREEMERVVQGMNDFLKPAGTHLKFEFHDELKEYYVSIVDDVTHEVVKEIPAKKMLDMYAAMTEFLGILVDKKI